MIRITSAVVAMLMSPPGLLEAQKVNFVVHGKVSNWSFPAKAILFYNYDGKVFEDSGTINHGLFTLHGTAAHKEDAIYLMVTKSGNRMAPKGVKLTRIYADAKSISVVITDSLDNVIVTGGPLNRDEARLKTELALVDAKRKAAEKNYVSAQHEQKLNSFREKFQQDSVALEHEKKNVYLNFMTSHPASFVSLEALDSLGEDNPSAAADFERQFNALTPEVRSTAKGIKYAAKIAELKNVAIGSTAPLFSLPDTSGKSVSLQDFKGKYVLLDFWASWCPPCRAESPFIADALTAYQDKNFTVLGVSLDNPDKKKEWLTAIHDDHLTWPQVASLTMWENEAAKLYSVTSIPQNFLINPDGKIIAKNLRGAVLKEKLKELFDR